MKVKAFLILMVVTVVTVMLAAMVAERWFAPGFERGIVIAAIAGLVVFPLARWFEHLGWIRGGWRAGGGTATKATRSEPTGTDATRSESTGTDATRCELTGTGVTRSECTHPESTRPECARPESTRPESTRAQFARSAPGSDNGGTEPLAPAPSPRAADHNNIRQ